MCKIKNETSQVRYNEMAGTLKLDTSGANEPKGTTLPPYPQATNQQTGGLCVLALPL